MWLRHMPRLDTGSRRAGLVGLTVRWPMPQQAAGACSNIMSDAGPCLRWLLVGQKSVTLARMSLQRKHAVCYASLLLSPSKRSANFDGVSDCSQAAQDLQYLTKCNHIKRSVPRLSGNTIFALRF